MSGASTDTSQKIDKQKTGVQSSDSLHMKRKELQYEEHAHCLDITTSQRMRPHGLLHQATLLHEGEGLVDNVVFLLLGEAGVRLHKFADRLRQ